MRHHGQFPTYFPFPPASVIGWSSPPSLHYESLSIGDSYVLEDGRVARLNLSGVRAIKPRHSKRRALSGPSVLRQFPNLVSLAPCPPFSRKFRRRISARGEEGTISVG